MTNPGPWKCKDTSHHAHDYRLFALDGSPLPVNAPANDHSEQRAYARIIEAAPVMLFTLKQIAAHDPITGLSPQLGALINGWIDNARAAIAQIEESK